MYTELIQKVFPLLAINLLAACSFEPSGNDHQNADSTTVPLPVKDNIFYNIPSPVQQAQLLERAGTPYDNSVLNSPENTSKYVTANSKALNLGVYASDLSYTAAFNKPQDVASYLDASRRLAEELNLKGDFYTGIMKRMDKNSGNKDSMLQIVSEVYDKSNESLKENDQSHISSLVVVGSFIEAMYIATQSAEEVIDKEVVYERIGEFKGTLNNLVGLLATAYDNDFSNELADLKNIKAIYDETPGTRLSEDQITRITKQIKAIRIRVTNS